MRVGTYFRQEKKLFSAEFSNGGEHFSGVALRADSGPDFGDFSVRRNEEGVALGDLEAHVVTECAVGFGDIVLGVCEEAEGEALLCAELLVAVGRVDADADDDGVL